MKTTTLTEEEKQTLIADAKKFLASKCKEFICNEAFLYTKMQDIVNDEYCEAFGMPNDLLYKMICHAEIADVYFLHSKYSELKSKSLIECINRENYILADELIDRMKRISKYNDYNMSEIDDWMHSNLNTMMGVILHYPLEEYMNWNNEPVTAAARNYAIKLSESMLPYLDKSSQKELYSGLMFADNTPKLVSVDSTPKYLSLYLEDLFFVVKNYARNPRRKSGFGSSMSINDTTLKIKKSFSYLIRMNRTKEIKQILDIIKAAGDNLKPINYKMFVNAIRHQFGEEIYEQINADY